MERDFTQELADIKHELDRARIEEGRLQGTYDGLGRTRSELSSKCSQLGVEPNLKAIQKELAKSKSELTTLINEIDRNLRKE